MDLKKLSVLFFLVIIGSFLFFSFSSDQTDKAEIADTHTESDKYIESSPNSNPPHKEKKDEPEDGNSGLDKHLYDTHALSEAVDQTSNSEYKPAPKKESQRSVIKTPKTQTEVKFFEISITEFGSGLQLDDADISGKFFYDEKETKSFQELSDESGLCRIAYDCNFSEIKGTVSKPGYFPVRFDLKESYLTDTPEIQLQKTTVILGKVLDKETEEPISNAEISLTVFGQLARGTKYDSEPLRAVSDKDGYWQIDNVPESLITKYGASYKLSSHHDEYVADKTFDQGNLNYEKLTSESFSFYMEKAKSLHGWVFSKETRAPIQDAHVHLGNFADRTATTDANGFFKFTDIIEGDHKLTAEAGDYQAKLITVSIDESFSPPEFYLEPAFDQVVEVLDRNSNPLENVKIELRLVTSFAEVAKTIERKAFTDDQGIAVIKNAPTAGIYDLTKKGCAELNNCEIKLSDQVKTVYLNDLCHVTGKAYDIDTGEPVNKISFKPGYTHSKEHNTDIFWIDYKTQKVSDGKYRLNLFSSTRGHVVEIRAEGYKPAQSPLFFNENENITYDICLEKVKEDDYGIIYSPDGSLCRNAEVAGYISSNRSYIDLEGFYIKPYTPDYFTKTDSKGRFVMPDNLNLDFLAVSGREGFKLVTFSEFVNNEKAIYLDQWASIEGFVQDDPLAKRILLTIRAFENSPVIHPSLPPLRVSEYTSRSRGIAAEVDHQGSFKIDHVPAGIAEIRKMGNEHSYGLGKKFDIKPGAVREVVLKAAYTLKARFVTDIELDHGRQIPWVSLFKIEKSGKKENVYFKKLPGNSFQIKEIQPGKYFLSVILLEDKKKIASGEKEIVIAPEKLPADRVIDIGEISLSAN